MERSGMEDRPFPSFGLAVALHVTANEKPPAHGGRPVIFWVSG